MYKHQHDLRDNRQTNNKQQTADDALLKLYEVREKEDRGIFQCWVIQVA